MQTMCFSLRQLLATLGIASLLLGAISYVHRYDQMQFERLCSVKEDHTKAEVLAECGTPDDSRFSEGVWIYRFYTHFPIGVVFDEHDKTRGLDWLP